MNDFQHDINDGLITAFIDSTHPSNLAFTPQFLSNDYRSGKKVLASIEDELKNCDSFRISVAFITMGGITPLLMTLKELEKRGIKGELLTTNYQRFTSPDALRKLHSLSNLTIRMFDTEAAGKGFHTKGYIFQKDNLFRIIIGSSNITKAALTENLEWNARFISTDKAELTRQILDEYEMIWNSEYTLEYDDFIDAYSTQYNIEKHQRAASYYNNVISLKQHRLKPNSMQVSFITNLKKMIDAGEERALLISATGTGKTYASAFAMRELGFRRVIFVTHRTQLSQQTMKSYRNVFGENISMGFLGNGETDYSSDIIFANVQTLSRDQHLNQFEKNAFDCIILDETKGTRLIQRYA